MSGVNGVPVRIWRNGQKETIFLSTRRSGESGARMKACKGRYRMLRTEEGRLAARIGQLMMRAKQIDSAGADCTAGLEAILEEQIKLASAMAEAKTEATNVAEELVRLSLAENYGEAGLVDALMDVMSDRQLEQALNAIELGEEPDGFFLDRGTPPSASTTGPSGGSAGAGLSSAGTPAPTSTPAGSA